jgi:hypothetical protein
MIWEAGQRAMTGADKVRTLEPWENPGGIRDLPMRVEGLLVKSVD